MMRSLDIALGGAGGALLRYWLSGFTHRCLNGVFPWGTLAVNLAGSFAIGLLWGASEAVPLSQNLKLFVFIGFLGSFTTFSTFSLENFHLIREGEFWLAAVNAASSLVLGIVLAFAGFFTARFLLEILR